MSTRSTKLPPLCPLTVAGIMGGTSADGLDLAIVRIAPRRHSGTPQLALLAHKAFPFPKPLRAAILAAQDAQRTSTAELAQLHWRMGLAYAEAYTAARAAFAGTVDLVGCHGQTIYHQSASLPYAGRRFACTWQIGEMAPLARAAGVPVYSNFRPADIVAGGQGAPLVPLLDQALYRDRRRTRILQNIGGTGNLTVVPSVGSNAPTIAFDTGPGNMVIDTLTQQLFVKPYDRNGRIAARGQILQPVIDAILREPFFALAPPRSAGREQFGLAFTAALLRACRRLSKQGEDAVATATALTAQSIALAIGRFATPAVKNTKLDLILSGGGANNRTLVAQLGSIPNADVLASDDPALPTPLPVEAKEAAAFALLAYMSHHRRPANVPTATGAREAVVLGQVTCA